MFLKSSTSLQENIFFFITSEEKFLLGTDEIFTSFPPFYMIPWKANEKKFNEDEIQS